MMKFIELKDNCKPVYELLKTNKTMYNIQHILGCIGVCPCPNSLTEVVEREEMGMILRCTKVYFILI